jgi:hypothetical protein
MPVIDWNVKQGSADWYRLRAGIPTASEFHHIITPKKMQLAESRKGYQCRLLAERLLNWQSESLDKIKHIEDGKVNEPFAIAQLEEIEGIETERVGFIRTNDRRFGASPDRVTDVSADRGHVGIVIEAKAPTIPKQFEYLMFGHDDAYRCQVQGQIWVSEADKALFYAYNPRMPAFRVETGRDDVFIGKLVDALNQFSDELEEMTERARRLGAFQRFAELVTPAEAEYGDRYRAPSDADVQAMLDGPIGEFG